MADAGSILPGLLSGIFGSALGALVTWWVGFSAAKVSRTVELYKEFNSAAMGQARIDAYAFLRSHPALSYDEYNQLSEARPLWEVVYFYQRLSQMLTNNLLLNRVVPRWFGETFVWWHEYSFRYGLKAGNWQGYRDVSRFYVWLEERANRRERINVPLWIADRVSLSQTEWKDWHDRGTTAHRLHGRDSLAKTADANVDPEPEDARGA